jgi:hypothetical protein
MIKVNCGKLTQKPLKSTILRLTVISFILLITSFSLQAQFRQSFRGNWNFEAPSAPPGYESGVMIITKDSVLTKYPGNRRLLPSSSLSFRNDTLTFHFTPDVDVTIILTSENKTKLTGMASWSSGESVVTLTKIQTTKAKK